MNEMIYSNYSDSIECPKLINIKDNIYALCFYIMKLIPAKYIIARAYRANRINPGFPVVDTSSGTFALGMGIVCAEMDLPFIVFGDSAIDPTLKNRLELLGGEVVIVDGSGNQSPQQARLKALHDHLGRSPESFWPQQYDNPDVLDSYAFVADMVNDALPENLTLVASVGSGGSACGVSRRLRALRPGTRLVGVDTFGSVLFGLNNGSRELRGLGNSIMPGNLHHDAFDIVHWVDRNGAFLHARNLLQEHAIFAGPTSGAAYQIALWHATEEPDRKIVFIAPDWGYRYQEMFEPSTDNVLNQARYSGGFRPKMVDRPKDASPPWSMLNWRRRRHADLYPTA
ncbi:MAG: pyridoxal-phosphate dependent enzyme [Pseudomonadota bacterium]